MRLGCDKVLLSIILLQPVQGCSLTFKVVLGGFLWSSLSLSFSFKIFTLGVKNISVEIELIA